MLVCAGERQMSVSHICFVASLAQDHIIAGSVYATFEYERLSAPGYSVKPLAGLRSVPIQACPVTPHQYDVC